MRGRELGLENSPHSEQVVLAAIAPARDGRYLLTQEKEGATAGLWDFPTFTIVDGRLQIPPDELPIANFFTREEIEALGKAGELADREIPGMIVRAEKIRPDEPPSD